MLVGLGLMLLTSMGELNGRWGLSTSSLPGMCPLVTQESESESNKVKVEETWAALANHVFAIIRLGTPEWFVTLWPVPQQVSIVWQNLVFTSLFLGTLMMWMMSGVLLWTKAQPDEQKTEDLGTRLLLQRLYIGKKVMLQIPTRSPREEFYA